MKPARFATRQNQARPSRVFGGQLRVDSGGDEARFLHHDLGMGRLGNDPWRWPRQAEWNTTGVGLRIYGDLYLFSIV